MSTPTKFKAEKWTTICGNGPEYDLWTVIMLDGDEAGYPCAFGTQPAMEEYAAAESKEVSA